MRIKQFDIWIADLNPTRGTEPGKIRPVIVVQSNLLSADHLSTLICPITTGFTPHVEVLRVRLSKSNSGLNRDSEVLIDQVRAIDNRRLVKKIGSAKGASTDQIKESLRIVMDLD